MVVPSREYTMRLRFQYLASQGQTLDRITPVIGAALRFVLILRICPSVVEAVNVPVTYADVSTPHIFWMDS